MEKKIFKIAKADTLKFYATNTRGKLLTKHFIDSGFNSHGSVIDVIISALPSWFDEHVVCIHIVCEEKELSKNINIRI